jgi:hypothetical protein
MNKHYQRPVGYVLATIAFFCWVQFIGAVTQNNSITILGHGADGSINSVPSYALGIFAAPPLTILALALLRQSVANAPSQAQSRVQKSTQAILIISCGIGGILVLLLLFAATQL